MVRQVRWGILSCGNISNDFVTAVRSLAPTENQQVLAVAARSLEAAQKFAAKHNVPRAYGSYAELIEDTDVDAVYVGTIHPAHYRLVSQLLRAGTPVLCEKPLCMTLPETRALVAQARQAGVLLMEAVWSRCFPAVQRLRQELASGAVGAVQHVSATLGVSAPADGRLGKMELGGGATLDLGIYCAQMVSLVMGNRRWSELRALGHLNQERCDVCVSASMTFPGGELATTVCHALAQLDNQAVVTGDKGTLKLLPPFHCPTQLVLPSGEVLTFPLPDSVSDADYIYINSAGLQYEAMHFAQCLREGLKESPLMSLDDTLYCADMMESMRKQAGVVYPQDEL